MTNGRVNVDRIRRQLERSAGVWTQAEVDEIKARAAEWGEKLREVFEPIGLPEPACICDGATYRTDAENRDRRPFIVRAGCPIHGSGGKS